jgi:hypothetical protein
MPTAQCQAQDRISFSFLSDLEAWEVTVYAVFGDESHDETRARVFAVAGIFGSRKDWKRLRAKWSVRTGGRVFHAADCDTDRGEFADTSHSENKRLYRDLANLLAESKLLGFGTAMDLGGHRIFFPDTPNYVPYYICFRDVIIQCINWTMMSVPQGIVKFTFDSRRESNYNAGVLYDYLVNCPEWKDQEFDEIAFASKKNTGIQVADLYAREVMKHLDNMIGPVKRPMRRSMTALRKTSRFGCNLLMTEYFENFRQKYVDLSERIGMTRKAYLEWLNKHKLEDCISSRHRYLISLG